MLPPTIYLQLEKLKQVKMIELIIPLIEKQQITIFLFFNHIKNKPFEEIQDLVKYHALSSKRGENGMRFQYLLML